MSDFLGQVTQFLGSLLPWICLIGFWLVLRKLSRIERTLIGFSLVMAAREGFNPAVELLKKIKGGVRDAKTVNSRGQGDSGSKSKRGSDKNKTH